MEKESNSLVIATYNWPQALELVLESIKLQSLYPDEIIIADDGSGDETKAIIEKFSNEIQIPVLHVWQEDLGFRKAKILNKAIAKASGAYIIQVDGDCILHSHFVEDHLRLASKNCYLFGSRVKIKESHLKLLFKSKQIEFHILSSGIAKRSRALYAPFLGMFYKEHSNYSTKYRGCNSSYFKSDFIYVNGYNEDFEGWGREDSELVLRFHNNDIKARRLRYRAIVYHIYHQEKPMDRFEYNNRIERKTVSENIKWTDNGVDKYLEDLK